MRIDLSPSFATANWKTSTGPTDTVPFAIRPHIVSQGEVPPACAASLYIDGKRVGERRLDRLEDGRWAVPRDLSMFAMMSDTKLDLTMASLPVGGVVNVELTAVMCAVKIIVPPGMRVINEMHSFMADVRSGADEIISDSLSMQGAPVIRLRGTAFMSEVKVKVRRREEPIYNDDDE